MTKPIAGGLTIGVTVSEGEVKEALRRPEQGPRAILSRAGGAQAVFNSPLAVRNASGHQICPRTGPQMRDRMERARYCPMVSIPAKISYRLRRGASAQRRGHA